MTGRRPPERDVQPPVQRLRIRYAKRGPLRFSSHRDFQRALERALRRARIPMAFSAGFSPHPRISYANAAPTGTASEAEYVEIAVIRHCDPEAVRAELDAALPPGLDIMDVVAARTADLVARLEASQWLIELPDVAAERIATAWAQVWAASALPVERLMKQGRRTLDIRPALVTGGLIGAGELGPTLEVTVRNTTPTVRPAEILVALTGAGAPIPATPARATRLAQGPLGVGFVIGDPLAPDRAAAASPVG